MGQDRDLEVSLGLDILAGVYLKTPSPASLPSGTLSCSREQGGHGWPPRDRKDCSPIKPAPHDGSHRASSLPVPRSPILLEE